MINKYQEALDEVKNTKILLHQHDDIVNEMKIYEDDDLNIELLQELVDKATPKKPLISHSIKGEEDSYCPTCTYRFSRPVYFARATYKHCANCGQAIDW